MIISGNSQSGIIRDIDQSKARANSLTGNNEQEMSGINAHKGCAPPSLPICHGPMKLLIPSVVAVLALGVSVYGDDAADARKAAAAERKAEAVRKAEVKSLKQEVQALQSQKTSGAKEYGDKVRAINAKKDVIRAKEQQ